MTGNITINNFLLPLSWLYGFGVWVRNKLFDWGIFPSEEFPVNVISVGNITAGGTGKTPHTEYLIRILRNRLKIAVLSRGYKRTTSGYLLADESATSLTIGDEPFQIYKKFPGVLVAVDSNRRRGITNLMQLPEDQRPELILLDDAYQHRYVKPSVNMLLMSYERMVYDDALLPAGRLRESASGKSRADIIIVTKCPDAMRPIDYRLISNNLELYPHQVLFFTSFTYGGLVPVFNSDESYLKQKTLESIKNDNVSVLLVAGIAYPQGLIEKVKQYTHDLTTLAYPDHHAFSLADFEEISTKFKQITNPNKLIITTEKDAARILNNTQLDEEMKSAFYYLPIEVVFNSDQENIFKQKIENHVKGVKRNRILA